jgi:hypothetical protein
VQASRTGPVKNSDVPNANWNGDQVNFDANDPGNVNDKARFRSAGEGFLCCELP